MKIVSIIKIGAFH